MRKAPISMLVGLFLAGGLGSGALYAQQDQPNQSSPPNQSGMMQGDGMMQGGGMMHGNMMGQMSSMMEKCNKMMDSMMEKQDDQAQG